MIRRRFLGFLAGATGAAALVKMSHAAGADQTVTYKVAGFTCITCATGLETILQRHKGVAKVSATYPDGITTVRYNPPVVREEQLRAAIEEMGFKASLT